MYYHALELEIGLLLGLMEYIAHKEAFVGKNK
jgi:hypothetical protein